ncbi:hypothetical protein [Actinokineospora pegani]|uniref:hypothetical protein n=1 Tax=Actinokineospora pegani TaxID=2654637 RepID=UPI0012EAA1E8|nr:hypothetical protein [Actinokineospora pegani]
MPFDQPQDVGAIGASMAQFVNAASAGQFAVNEQGGQALIAAIDQLQDWLVDNLYKLRDLEQEPPLGSSHAAEVMKPFMVNVATDHQGFLTQLRALNENLAKARKAIEIAMSNYQQTDSDITAALTREEP